ncbi:MAG: hypothetical protein ABI867_29950 [Kofleriaceae bacterium]
MDWPLPGSSSCRSGSDLGTQILISDNCISCHNGKESPRLGTVEEVRAASSRIMEAAVATTAMPDGTDMDLAERELLGEWLACGAP